MTLHEVILEENAAKIQQTTRSSKKFPYQQKFLTVHLIRSFLKNRIPRAVTYQVHYFSKLLGRGKQFCTWSVDISIFMHI